MRFLIKTFLCCITLLVSCKDKALLAPYFKQITSDIKKEYAPDKRVAIFNILITKKKKIVILSGETNLPEAYKKLTDSLTTLKFSFLDKIRILPDSAIGENAYAIARNSVINIRSTPKHAAELGTQGLLGMPLKVLDKKGDFYRVQTTDNYISWVDKGGIVRMNKTDFDNYNTSKKIIFTKNFGYVYRDESFTATVSDITLGATLKLIEEKEKCYNVQFPDKRMGVVKKQEAQLYEIWLQNLHPSPANITHVAKQMLGFPYLWGGTSAKGLDCSGFTKMVYLMNGFVIPRDASQQINAGKVVNKSLDFSELQSGDLLFFGKKATIDKKQKVVHVGIWLGNDKMEFIHSSGNVHISSMDRLQNNYDSINKNRYLGSRRYLNNKDKNIIKLD